MKRNEYHIVKQNEFPIYDGIHEAIVSCEDWETAQKKLNKLGGKREKVYNLEHEHLLSGVLLCPVCGAAMYGNVNRKRKPDGTIYKDHFYYACKHRLELNGHRCDYHKQWNQHVVDKAVEEVILKLVSNPSFEKALQEKIDSKVDTSLLEAELKSMKKQHQQYIGAKRKLTAQMDSLDIFDKLYDKKYQDMQIRLDRLYDDIAIIEESIFEQEEKIEKIIQNKINRDNLFQFLIMYDKIYQKFTDTEKKKFLNSFLESVEIFENVQSNGRLLKCINFKFPIFYNGKKADRVSWDGEMTAETVVQLFRKIPDRYVDFEINFDEMDLTSAERKVTYQNIKDYVLESYDFNIPNLNIAQVKSKLGITEHENYNKGQDGHKQANCPPEKEKAIIDAFRYFQMI